MNREQQIENLRQTLAGSSQFRRACQMLYEGFSDWPQRRPDVAETLAVLAAEESHELRRETARLIDRLIRSGFLTPLADGALLKPVLPLAEVLGVQDRRRRHEHAPEPPVIHNISAPPPQAPEPEAEPKPEEESEEEEEEETEDGSDGLDLSEAVLAGLYSIYLERKGGVFNADAVGRDLRKLFQEWKLPEKLWGSRKAIQGVINDCFDGELLEGVEEGYWRLTERGLAEAKSAYDAWHRRLEHVEHAQNSG
ncbi:hypothetical protein HYW17_00660 [Candidatus Uhrbacteria bacterium]|nr:hypothetical protein [Candidatus Uhrbacteria bacterium]